MSVQFAGVCSHFNDKSVQKLRDSQIVQEEILKDTQNCASFVLFFNLTESTTTLSFFFFCEKVYQSSNSLTRPNHTVAWPLVLCQEVYKFCQIKHADSLFILQCLYQYLTSALPLHFSLLLTVYSSDRLMDDTIR